MPLDQFNAGFFHIILFLSSIPHPNDAASSKIGINRSRRPHAMQAYPHMIFIILIELLKEIHVFDQVMG